MCTSILQKRRTTKKWQWYSNRFGAKIRAISEVNLTLEPPPCQPCSYIIHVATKKRSNVWESSVTMESNSRYCWTNFISWLLGYLSAESISSKFHTNSYMHFQNVINIQIYAWVTSQRRRAVNAYPFAECSVLICDQILWISSTQ